MADIDLDDLAERLDGASWVYDRIGHRGHAEDCRNASKAIEQLQAEVAGLQEQLRDALNSTPDDGHGITSFPWDFRG